MLNFLKSYGAYLAVVAAVVAAVCWYRTEIKRAEARGQAELMAEQADSAMAAMQDSLPVWSAREQAASERAQALQGDLDSLRALVRANRERDAQAIVAAHAVIQRKTDSLDTFTAADLTTIAAGLESLQESNRLCDDALGRCEQLVKTSDARIWDLQEQGRQKDALMHQQAATIDQLQNVRGSSMGTAGWVAVGIAAVEGVLLLVQALSGG